MRTSPLVFLTVLAISFLSGCTRAPEEKPVLDQEAPRSKDYVLGTVIEFNQPGQSDGYRVSGWSPPEKEFTWTEGAAGIISIPTPPNSGDLVLKIKLGGLINPPALMSQLVQLYANGEKIGEWQIGDPGEFVAPIPASATKAGGLKLEVRVPNAVSPKTLGLSEDTRVLGARCYHLTLVKAG